MNRFLNGEELKRLGEALTAAEQAGAHPYGVAIIRLLTLTGARRGEVSTLRWREVDFDRSMLRLERSKTGAKIIPISAGALAILSGVGRTESEFVFSSSSRSSAYQGVGKVWTDVRKRAELEEVRLHDLRHTFASIGAGGGFGLPVIGAILGHHQPATTARYAHLADDPLRTAVDRISGSISAAMAGGSAQIVPLRGSN